MLQLNPSKLDPRVRNLIILIVTSVSATQLTAVKDKIVPLLANHPHLSTIVGGCFIVLGLLVRPDVQIALGIKHDEKKVLDQRGNVLQESSSTSVVALPEGVTADGSITVTK